MIIIIPAATVKGEEGGNTYERDRDRKIRKIREEKKNPIETLISH